MLLLMVVAVLISSAIGTTTVYADDGGGTTGESSEPAGEETLPGDEVTPAEPTGDEEQPVTLDEATPAESTGDEEQPVTLGEATSAEPTGDEKLLVTLDEETLAKSTGDEEQPVTSVVEEQPSVEEPVSVSEILEQLPAGTELVVVNEVGKVEPLVTEAAAEIIATSDPIWCKDGTNPGSSISGDCTSGWATVTELIANLTAVPGTFSGTGTIFFSNTSTYSTDDVTFDGGTLTGLGALTLQGGWNGSGNALWGLSGTYGLSGVTTFSVPVTIQNWASNVFINDIEIVSGAATVDHGLGVAATGNIELNNVYVHNTAGAGDGAKLSNIGGGNVSINDSEFNNNLGGNGLQVESSGAITLNTTQANGNGLTGAYLNNCLYASGLCQGNDLVTVTSTTSNLFNENGFDGLVIDAGGGIALDHVAANDNGLNGATLTSTDTNDIGNVDVTQSQFNLNANGSGLDILADGNINLTDVNASDNRSGVVLDATDGVGAVTVGTSNFTDNTSTGLHVESGSTIALTSVAASNNGTNGAYLDATGNINITNSTFNDNVHFNFPADPGLYANSNGGNITLLNVIADGNNYGAGGVLTTNNNGAIGVTGGHFNGNGTFGIQAQTQNGNIILDGVTASLNLVKGAYLNSYGLGDVLINNNSVFVENGSYGIYAATSEGDINLDQVTVTGNNVTDYGAVLVTEDGGTVFVNNSAFTLNTTTGLEIASSGQVDLINVTADQNGGNAVEVYSTYAKSCRCADSKVVNVQVNVDGGTFTNNGMYGLMVRPGPSGNLVFVNPSIFSGNGLGDYLLDLSEPVECGKCSCDEETNPDEGKGPNIVDVPFTGGDPVRLDYENFSSTILRLPNGSSAQFIYPSFDGFGGLEGLLEENLPGRLGAGTNFIDGMHVSLTDGEGNLITDQDGTITIKFKLPEDSHGRYSILYWDPTLNDGTGGWVQLPLFEAGTSFPLNPDDPEDGRTILSGVQQIGDTITATVNFPGIFILVAR